MIRKLLGTGKSQAYIAKKVGCSQGAVSRELSKSKEGPSDNDAA